VTRTRRALTAGVALTLTATSLLAAAGVAPAASAAPSGCTPVAVLAFRGSGEQNIWDGVTSYVGKDYKYTGTNLVTNGWEGFQLWRMLKSYAPIAYPDGFHADSVPVIGVGEKDSTVSYGYDAIDAGWEVLDRLNDSAIHGSTAAIITMGAIQKKQMTAGCTTRTKFILAGYSQGAMAARFAAQMAPTDVIGVIDIGDPYQKPNAPGNEGTKQSGNGIVRWKHPIIQGTADKFYDLGFTKAAVCHEGDPICDFGWPTVGKYVSNDFSDHVSYYTDAWPKEAPAKAKQIADLAHDAWKKAQTPGGTRTGSADVVFAIDTTGSMGPYIAQAVATAQTAAENTLKKSPGSRVGLVQYRDHGDAFVAQTVVPLTTDFSALTAGLATLAADGGGDIPEAVYSGIVQAASQTWRPGIARSIVVIGDAAPHDPEPETGYTAASVTALLLGKALASPDAAAAPSGLRAEAARVAPAAAATDGSPIVLYDASADSDLTASLQPIVDATGGLSLNMDDASGLDDALQAALEDTVEAPIAAIGVPTPVIAGLDVTVSGTGSAAGDPNLTYEFDLDGDGTFETPAPDGFVNTTFADAGKRTVALRVTDSRGRTSIAQTEVEVLPASALTPILDPATPTVSVGAASTVVQGTSLPVIVTGGTPTDYLLVPGSGGAADVWTTKAALTATVPTDWTTSGLAVPATVPAGDYRLVIGTSEGAWGLAPVKVTAADGGTGSTPTPTPTPGQSTPPVDPGAGGGGTTTTDTGDSQTLNDPSMAATGSDIVGFVAGGIALAVLLIATGAVLIVRRRRRAAS
jgi:Mg-chelatase subunit ChlD